ncbi:DUF2933 domain-containing protein [Proteinivorax tanatarense]|uniref:DUF2933 domain-containing protein n=1 Tax=Proteinivorax tanatarense TaxID=1260629 RepID=A0AAU7VNZ6_9FIRM
MFKSKKSMICCLIPILLLVLFLARGGTESNASFMPYLFLIICPLMHIGMFFFMFKGDNGQNKTPDTTIDK